MPAVTFDVDLSDVRALHWDGDVLWVGTGGGVEVYDPDGERLARALDLPSRDVVDVAVQGSRVVVGTVRGAFSWDEGWVALGPERPVAAVTAHHVVYRDGSAWPDGGFSEPVVEAAEQGGVLYGFTADGRLLGPEGERLLPGPVADVAVVGDELRIACHLGAAILEDGDLRVLSVLATAAGEVWGTAEGALVDDRGVRLGAVPAGVHAVLRVDGTLFAGTADGLWRVRQGTERLTDTTLCGGFVTGLARWRGDLVVGTFDGGACVARDGRWTPLDLPTPLVNDVLAVGDELWVATSEGLVHGERVYEAAVGGRHVPGTNHTSVNALAAGPRGLWILDVLGPTELRDGWRRQRLQVPGTSYQSVAACRDGAVWIGSEDAGVAVRHAAVGRSFLRSPWRRVTVLDGLPEDWVTALACAGPGAAWVGTYRRGVGRVDRTGFHPVVGLEDAWVQALAVDGDVLWVGTADGLFRVRGADVERVSPSDVHALLLEDDTLWIGTTTGLERLPLS